MSRNSVINPIECAKNLSDHGLSAAQDDLGGATHRYSPETAVLGRFPHFTRFFR